MARLQSNLAKRLLFLCAFSGLVIGAGLIVRALPSWEWLAANEQGMRERVADSPLTNWCLGLCIYFLLSFIPGLTGKSVAIGWLFGFLPGLLMVEIGLTGAAIGSFLAGRVAFRRFADIRWHRRLYVFRKRFARDGVSYLLMLRLAHAPFSLVNYAAGATRVPLSVFAWTTMLGILPGSVVFVFAGSQIPSLRLVVELGPWSLIDVRLLIALLACAALPLVTRLIVHHISRQIHRLHVVVPTGGRHDEPQPLEDACRR